MRKGVKALSVLMLFCVLLGFTGCGDNSKILGKWKQSSFNSGYSKLKDEYGEIEFTNNGKYTRVSSYDHVGFSGAAASQSGSFQLDSKAHEIMLTPDDGSTSLTLSYTISDDQLTIRTLDGSDIVYFKR